MLRSDGTGRLTAMNMMEMLTSDSFNLDLLEFELTDIPMKDPWQSEATDYSFLKGLFPEERRSLPT